MKGETNKIERVCSLDCVIIKRDKVIVFDHDDIDILSILCDGLRDRKIENVVICQNIEESFNCEVSTYVTRQEMGEILEVYRMYDFSDKVFVVSDSNQYGSIFNYVRNGIMTKQEMAEALLCKIC